MAACGRRFGKTKLALYWLTTRDNGSAISGKRVAWFAPTNKLLMEVWEEAERTLRPVTRKSNRQTMRIELVTGGVIDFWTLEDKDAGRGRRYHRIVIDEAAHARYLKEAWERAVSPTLTDYRGQAWFISTPNGLNYFYELFRRGEDPSYPDWESFHMPSTANPHLRPEEIEAKQRELPELVFRQEYLAQFVTFGGGLIKPEMLVMGECPPHLRPVLGVDLAISERDGADYTAIVAMARDPDTGIVYIKEVERFRAGFHEVLTRIKAAAARHTPSIVAIEQTQFQAAVVQELARTTTLPVRGVRPDRDKVTRFAPLLTRFEQRLVRLDPSGCPAAFRDELLAFPDSANDDMVDAASYAFAALGMGQGGYVAAGGRVFRWCSGWRA
ncbi:phage terminase large subunit [Tepidimonas taiwanensis]|uniref:phage terminase large subunit n=1 Tax=Tepidimonas taiwanensis TaxID=307486 RepID=UPI001C8F3316|nr:phage terminase large subunit [Tepidimonas taiwanensis]UBQ04469.1 phage terminase large subunit [Tepidimonas taiwanensis]